MAVVVSSVLLHTDLLTRIIGEDPATRIALLNVLVELLDVRKGQLGAQREAPWSLLEVYHDEYETDTVIITCELHAECCKGQRRQYKGGCIELSVFSIAGGK